MGKFALLGIFFFLWVIRRPAFIFGAVSAMVENRRHPDLQFDRMKLPCGQCRQAFRRRRCGFQHVIEISVSRALLCCVVLRLNSLLLLWLPAILVLFFLFIYLDGGPTPGHLTYKRTSSSSFADWINTLVSRALFWGDLLFSVWYT